MNQTRRSSVFCTSARTVGLLVFFGAAGALVRAFQKAAIPSGLDLDALVKNMAAYCQKLEGSAFDFVCLEEIKETIDPRLDLRRNQTVFRDWTWAPGRTIVISGSPRRLKHTCVYDYQCIRSGQSIREMRTLLKENGKKMNVPNAALKTSIVVFGTALLGPVGLFGERFQSQYDYSVVGRDKIEKRSVVIIDAQPKTGAVETRNLYGKAWVDPVTSDILKIEWSDSRVGHYELFEKRGESYGRTPRLIIRSDFSVEKNGIRFPTHLSVEETYLGKRGPAFVRSRTDVHYKDFKFFTVEVEVRH
ncbi:MAG: hypothetical protein AB1715_01755 [Acidobacteriota bacterium]